MTTYAFEPAMFSLFSLTGPSCLCKWCKHMQVPTTYCSHESRDSGSLRRVSLSAVRTSVWFFDSVSFSSFSQLLLSLAHPKPSMSEIRWRYRQVLSHAESVCCKFSESYNCCCRMIPWCSMYHALPLSSCTDWQWWVTQAPGRGKQLRLLPQAPPSAFKETFRSCRKMSWTIMNNVYFNFMNFMIFPAFMMSVLSSLM